MAIVIFAWAGIAVLSILSLALTLQPEFADAAHLYAAIAAFLVMFAAFAVGAVVIGLGLWKLQKWARVIMLTVAFLLIFLYAISTLIVAARGADSFLLIGLTPYLGFGGWVVWYLFRTHVKQAFATAGAPLLPPDAPPPAGPAPPAKDRNL